MIAITLTDLRHNSKRYFDAVERGESLEVHRRGRPVAIVSPVRQPSVERWRQADPLHVSGLSVRDAILGRREESR